MNPVLGMILITISPILELRVAIPFGVANGLSPLNVFLICVGTNILIIPMIFFVLHFFFEEFFKIPIIGKRMHKIMDRTHRKAGKYIEKYGYVGLTLFVAIPLPVTGAYTGCLAAHLLEMEKHKAMIAIAIGVAIAGILITMASMGVLNLWRLGWG